MPDTPADRCRHPREAEIQLRRVEGGPGRIDLGLAGIARGDGAVEPLPGDDLPRIQQLGSLVFGARQQRRGLGLAQARPGGILRRLEHARVDEEQLLALLYQAAFRHRNVLDVAGDARPQFYLLDSGQRAGELGVGCHRANHHLGDGNAWRGARRPGRRRFPQPAIRAATPSVAVMRMKCLRFIVVPSWSEPAWPGWTKPLPWPVIDLDTLARSTPFSDLMAKAQRAFGRSPGAGRLARSETQRAAREGGGGRPTGYRRPAQGRGETPRRKGSPAKGRSPGRGRSRSRSRLPATW